MACPICRFLGAYAYNWARLLDQAANTLIGGDPRQTVSARLGRAEQNGKMWAARICKVISFAFREKDHCLLSVIEDDNRYEVIRLGLQKRAELAMRGERLREPSPDVRPAPAGYDELENRR